MDNISVEVGNNKCSSRILRVMSLDDVKITKLLFP
jgi:hypothetical protein